MLSIIFSSYQPKRLNDLKENLAATVGIEYEVIVIENKGEIGLCEAYNQGAGKAKFPYLCFLHEDTIFKTLNWAESLVKHFEADLQVGLIGTAGTIYKSLSPGGWGHLDNETDRINIVQHFKDDRQPEHHNNLKYEFENVVCVDGVFLFTRKKIWEENKFDQNTFKHFHCYDLDFSLSIGRAYKVQVTNAVLLEHFSPGGMDHNWIAETIKLSTKWCNLLPKGSISKSKKIELEWKQKNWTILKMITFKLPFSQIVGLYFGYGFFKFFSVKNAWQNFKLIIKYKLSFK
ncbi:MAG: hypothetical protein EOP43_00955 [Sphingobacteriaceae bacterium]|nr:MAG: hypothetical protein EOP43_00955 [Sphingobacteriaceae bacterium]